MVELRFKGGRKEFYRNRQHLSLTTGDAVVVDMPGGGWHVGHVSLKGELVRLQMKKKKVESGPEIKPIQRLATEDDLTKLREAREQEPTTMYRARTIVGDMRLQMKLSDVEMQADRSRAIFFYSAEDRVDFRDLVRRLGDDLRTRVEMRQISLRQEAGRIGGIGSCGRELCCSTWLTDFKTVSTTAARYQQLSLNPAKLAGQCGRLKCCLNYELDTYLDAIKDIPSVTRPLLTTNGEAFLQKTDIFRGLMWFGFKGDSEWHRLPAARVREIVEMNKRGERPDTLMLAPEPSAVPEAEVAQVEGSLERLDDKFSVSTGKKKKKKKKDGGIQAAGAPAERKDKPRERKPENRDPNRERKPKPPKEARVGGPEIPKDPNRPAPPERVAKAPGEPGAPRPPRPPRPESAGPPREPREPQQAREPREPRDPQQPREPREPRDPQQPREPREPRDPQQPREPRADGSPDSANRRRRGGRGRNGGRPDGPAAPSPAAS